MGVVKWICCDRCHAFKVAQPGKAANRGRAKWPVPAGKVRAARSTWTVSRLHSTTTVRPSSVVEFTTSPRRRPAFHAGLSGQHTLTSVRPSRPFPHRAPQRANASSWDSRVAWTPWCSRASTRSGQPSSVPSQSRRAAGGFPRCPPDPGAGPLLELGPPHGFGEGAGLFWAGQFGQGVHQPTASGRLRATSHRNARTAPSADVAAAVGHAD